MTFSELGISKDFGKGLKELGIITPTKIQEQAIPVLLKENTDFIGKAPTGTGKTAAFGLPLLASIDAQKPVVQGIVLAPTRELGQQIAKQLFRFTKYSEKIFTEAVYGGEKIDRQLERLKRPTHVIVATPGRLIDLMERRAVDLSKVHTVILDEADEMLSMGFKKDLITILSKAINRQKTWLFSATMPPSLFQIIDDYLKKDAVRMTVDKSDTVNKNIEHQFVVGDDLHKLDTLIHFLKTMKAQRGIIFTRTKGTARKLSKQLTAKNYNAGLLEGDMTQKERDKVMRAFKNKSIQWLVATDVAARGIDVDNLAFVAHFQLPDQIEYYVHRSGRTARAGNKGLSLVFVNSKEVKVIRAIERELGIRFHQIR